MDRRPIVLAAFVAAFAVTGCGERKIEVGKAEKLIQKAVEEQVGAPVRSIVCPNEVPLKANANFTCAVVGVDGTKGIATATQTDDKGRIRVDATFLHKEAAEQSIQADLRKRAPRAEVVCQDIIVVKAGGKFVCQADLGEIRATVRATQTSGSGAFTYNVQSR
jgi:hypothetical protein